MKIQAVIEKTITVEFERDPDLTGQPIRLMEASRKYNIAFQTLARWADRGLLRVLNHQSKRLELDEADVQLATCIYKTVLQHTDNTQRAGRVVKNAMLDTA
ncbi:MAG: hypothetical protein JXA33_10835 [Anaerolineae bacterium]|nr:hypothetical protein [Anaerolineae bacterium]